MNFDFSDDQKQLRDQARKFLAEKCPPKAVRNVLEGKEPYDRQLWKGLAEMGFLGIAIPEEFGGAGGGGRRGRGGGRRRGGRGGGGRRRGPSPSHPPAGRGGRKGAGAGGCG